MSRHNTDHVGDITMTMEFDGGTKPNIGQVTTPRGASTMATTVTYDDETYYFCCHGCAESFEEDPEPHLKSTLGSETHP